MKATARLDGFEDDVVLVSGMKVKDVRHWAGRAATNRNLLSHIVNIAVRDTEVKGAKAAWILSHTAVQVPSIVAPYFDKIEKSLQGAEGGRLRELFKVLLLSWKDDNQFAICVNWSFWMLADLSGEIAVMHAAKGFLEQACRRYPDLTEEFELHLEAVAMLHGRPWQDQVKKTMERLRKLRAKSGRNPA